MKKIYFLLLIFSPAMSFSQSILNKFKQKVKDRIEQRTDEGMDKVIDEAENKTIGDGKKSKPEKPEDRPREKEETPKIQPEKAQTASFKSFSRYDFVPGDEIVYTEDFAQDVIGELPLNWSSNNRGETVAIEGMEGKWMRMFKNGHFVSPYIKSLPENFTMEFDVRLNLPPNEKHTNYPLFVIRLMNTEPDDEKARKFFHANFYAKNDVKILLAPDPEEGSTISIFTTGTDAERYFSQEGKELHNMSDYLKKPIHFAIWVQKERFRLWINGEKVYDLPQAIPGKAAFNRMEFETEDSPYTDEEVGYYVSNIKFAQGTPDMRNKLITEGKLVTNGILFDVNSDKIKPESAGVLQEIAKVLKENATVKIKIIGHTDSDGDEAKNLDLSRRRAISVRKVLNTEFGIDAARIETDGKGETQPVAENNTKEGKAKNRRVEFIKL